jgi:hypothetical protein
MSVGTGPESLDRLRQAAEQAARDHGWSSTEYRTADHALLLAERQAAADSGGEYVVDFDLGVTWDPNATEPWLVQREGAAVLVVRSDGNRDQDRRLVILEWIRCSGAVLSGPNDEGWSGHRLWKVGGRGCLWAGEVINSKWVAALKDQNRVHPRHDPARFEGIRHFVLYLKDSTFEVLCRDYRAHRDIGPPLTAAASVLGNEY